MSFNHEGQSSEDSEGRTVGIPFHIPESAQDLPMRLVGDTLNLGWFMHMNAVTHTLIALAQPDHQCGAIDVEQLLDEDELKEQLSDQDVRIFFVYEESMGMIFEGMRRLFADHGYPELAPE